MPSRKQLNKPLNIGEKYPNKTVKEIIDLGDSDYINKLDEERICFFSPEVWKYIENKIK